jgi:hypothetical protein
MRPSLRRISLLGKHTDGGVFRVRAVRERRPSGVLLRARVRVDLILEVVRSERRVVVGIDGQLDSGVAAVVDTRAPSGVPEGLRPDRGVHRRRCAFHGREKTEPCVSVTPSDDGDPKIGALPAKSASEHFRSPNRRHSPDNERATGEKYRSPSPRALAQRHALSENSRAPMGLTDNRCANRVLTGVALGGTVGGAVGACYGTYEAFSAGIPGMLKVRHVGRTTVGSAALFGLFLGAGSLLQCGRR